MQLFSIRRVTMCLILFAALPAISPANDTLTVKLTSGREFSGSVDIRTDAKTLWLRYGGDGITILRPIDWDRVESADYQDRPVPEEELRKLARQIRTKQNPSPIDNSTAETNWPRDATETDLSYAQRARQALSSAPRVQSVQFDACLANWDADVETDGLVVRVYPLSAGGDLARVNGTIYVELFTMELGRFQPTPTRIASWSRRVFADQIGRSGLEIKLSFQAIHPEFTSHVAAHGLIHMRFVAPGHGVFEHSQDAIRIRPFSPVRDQLERNGHGRFLSNELLGRSH